MILRLSVATFLIHDAYVLLTGVDSVAQALPPVIAAVAGVLLLTGLWTPIAGLAAALLELFIAFSRPGDLWAHALAVAIAAGLALLGPGAWSIDALAYGRKRISIRER